jgi:hypothetical protein
MSHMGRRHVAWDPQHATQLCSNSVGAQVVPVTSTCWQVAARQLQHDDWNISSCTQSQVCARGNSQCSLPCSHTSCAHSLPNGQLWPMHPCTPFTSRHPLIILALSLSHFHSHSHFHTDPLPRGLSQRQQAVRGDGVCTLWGPAVSCWEWNRGRWFAWLVACNRQQPGRGSQE